MVDKSMTLVKRDDNSSEDAEKFVAWARKFDGVDAHIVYDYITVGSSEYGDVQSVQGALNGATLQWDHDNDGNPDGAVHVRAGGTATRTADGFDVTNPPIMIEVLDEAGNVQIVEAGQ